MAKTRGRNMRKRALSGHCACSRELGAHLQWASARRCAPGARRLEQDNGNVVPCLGAWGPSCRGPMRSFWNVLLLFLLTLLLKHNWLGRNLDFPNGLKLEVVSFSVFRNLSENELLWTNGITWLVYSSYELRRSMWSWHNALIMWNLVFGWNGGILELGISHTDLGQTWNQCLIVYK